MNQKNQKTGNSSAEVVAWDVDIEEEEPSEEKGILIPGYTSMVMKANTKEQTVSIGNPADNDCIFVIVLKLEDGTKLFESQELKPGEGLENITLDQELEAGEYQAVMDKIFYQNSGTEANEAMIKMARKYGIEKYGPNRYHIVTAKDGFHGRTFGAMSATGQPGNGCQVGFGPMTYGFSYAPYNDLKAFKDACTENTIAIMIEPVQGEGGVHPATQEFMKGLREFCDEKGMLLLLDEVQTGWCRTGAVMSYMNYGVKPDIVSMAKGLGGGMPIGAICATEEVSKAFTAGSHGTTFGGHPISCAAALAEVGELLDRDLAGNAKKVGDYFAAKLEKLPHVKEVRHQGLLVGVEFDDTISGVDVKHGCFDRKLLITAIGAHIIRMVPPLIVSEEECDKAVEIIEEAVKALS